MQICRRKYRGVGHNITTKTMLRKITTTVICVIATMFAAQAQCPNNEIWYTTSDGQKVELYYNGGTKNRLVSHTYADNKGVITMQHDIKSLDLRFSDCETLTSVTIPDCVTEIGWGAFAGCTGLKNITIPENVVRIENSAFAGCTGLTSIKIPNKPRSIADSAFAGCINLTNINIPSSVQTIGWQAFAGCSSLATITLPNSVTWIGGSAFAGCKSLASIAIPERVTHIGESAFEGCSSLKSFKGQFASEDGRCLIVSGKIVAFAPAGSANIQSHSAQQTSTATHSRAARS